MNPLLMCWYLQKVAVKTFARFVMEILMVLELAINVLESPEGCCEDICTFCLGNINGFAPKSMIRRLDCSMPRCYSSMQAAGLSLVLVAG